MLTQTRLKEVLNYDRDRGIFYWAINLSSRARLGMAAGWTRDGYRAINIDGKTYQVHRLAWLYVHGAFPAMIDHKNRDPKDNRIANLRECTQPQNSGNYVLSRRNKSGFRGVYWNLKDKKWYAALRTNGHTNHLGGFANKEDAAQAYKKAAALYFGEFMPDS